MRTLIEGKTSGTCRRRPCCVGRDCHQSPPSRRLANISIVLTLRLSAPRWCVLLSYLIVPLNGWRHASASCPVIWYHHTGDEPSHQRHVARHKYRQNLSGDSDWIDFMMFGIQLLHELLHRLLYSYWCVILLLHTEFSTHSRRISYYRHLTWHNTLLNYHEILIILASLPGRGPRSKQFVMPRYAYRAEV